MEREKWSLRSSKHQGGMPYAVVPEHMIVGSDQLTDKERDIIYSYGDRRRPENHTMVRIQLIRLVPAGFGGMESG